MRHLTSTQRRWVAGLDPERVSTAELARLARLADQVSDPDDLAAIDAAGEVVADREAQRLAEREVARIERDAARAARFASAGGVSGGVHNAMGWP